MYGSKIDNLKILKENELPVPDFHIVDFKSIVKSIPNIDENFSGDINKMSLSLKEDLKDLFIDINPIKLDKGLYAVRSSSNLEDSKEASFAGQFRTYLNVEAKDIYKRIKDCIYSLYNPNVLIYSKEKGIDISDLEMNVLVQEMIDPDLSGILFTSNPNGILNESVIVVGEGYGENVVTGKVETTSYYYHLEDKLYYYEGKNDYLNKDLIEELIELSSKITKFLGKYLDIEFSIKDNKIYILQARVITTLDPSKPLIMDNSNIVESYPGISLPMTCSFVDIIYSGVFRSVSKRILKDNNALERLSPVFEEMVGHANGRIYYKISNWYTIIQHLPFSKKIIPVWQEMLGVKNLNVYGLGNNQSFFKRVRTYMNFLYEFTNTSKNMEKLNKDFIKINKYFYDNFNSGMKNIEIIDLYNKIKEELLENWDITLMNDIYTFIFTGLAKKSLKKKYGDDEEKVNSYFAGISDLESIKPIRKIIKLAYEKDNLTTEEYKEKLKEYIDLYGDRNVEELKLESQTFRTNPELLEEQIKIYREDMERLKGRYEKITEVKEIDFSNEGFLTRYYLKKAKKGIYNREISRLNRSRIFGMVREMIRLLAVDFVNRELIESTDDIWYLNIEELFEMANKNINKKESIKEIKDSYEIFRKLPAYSRLIFEEREFDKNHLSINSHIFTNESNSLKGIPCSKGVVEGEVIVVNDITKVKDGKDKILVTKMTDPGWVFLLSTSKGVLSEKGSMLSHTAIVSRELGIPSIVGIPNLMNTLKTGDYIKIDGNTGEINILERKAISEVG